MDRHNTKIFIIQFVLFVVILGVGVIGFRKMKSMKKPPERKEAAELIPLVNAEQVYKHECSMVVHGYGTVQAKIRSNVVVEVAGKVVGNKLLKGIFFKADEILIEIDRRDYELAVKRAQSKVASAKVKLEQELAESDVARKEWELINPGKEPDSPLVFREPQVSEARAAILSAESDLEKAQLDLERTRISMPFDGRVADENVDIGEYVQAGKVLGEVYGTDVVEIEVPLEDFELAWFGVGSEGGSQAKVIADFAGVKREWFGQAVRLGGEIDPDSRMVKVVIEVKNPFEEEMKNGVGLMPGLFTEIEIQGKSLGGCISVKRGAIHNRDEVWLYKDGRLEVRKVSIVRSDRYKAYITEGLDDGDVVITSPMDAVVDGMKVRVEMEEQAG